MPGSAAAGPAAARIITGSARSYTMMPYQSYQIYQAERPKTAAEVRRSDDQLGHMAASVSWLWCRATRPIGLLRGTSQRPACSALLNVSR